MWCGSTRNGSTPWEWPQCLCTGLEGRVTSSISEEVTEQATVSPIVQNRKLRLRESIPGVRNSVCLTA